MEKISEHLSLKEVIKSNTASRKGISNRPTIEHLANIKILANEVFEPLRIWAGVPIGVSSCYRSKALNEAIGGSLKSQHCEGKAIDLDADIYGEITNAEIFEFISENLDYDQLIWEFGDDIEPAWIHVSYNLGSNRKQNLKAYKVDGKTKYKAI